MENKIENYVVVSVRHISQERVGHNGLFVCPTDAMITHDPNVEYLNQLDSITKCGDDYISDTSDGVPNVEWTILVFGKNHTPKRSITCIRAK